MTKYACVRYAKKSHCDYPSPMFTEYVAASEERFDEVIEKIAKGCEDFDVREISEECYNKIMEDERKMYGDDGYVSAEEMEKIKQTFEYWNW